MKPRVLARLVLLPALAVAVGGCLVPLKKYKALQAENENLKRLLDDREEELNTQQDSFRKRFEDVSRQLELYKKQAAAPKPETQKAVKAIDDERKRFEDQVRALGIGEVRDGRLVLQGALLFDLGKTTISKKGSAALSKIAAAFKGKDVLIQIDGHTDSTPIKRAASLRAYHDNMGLAAARALAVYRALARKGIPEKHMFIRSFGSSWPAASNATAASRARNRRVEILFIPQSLVKRAGSK